MSASLTLPESLASCGAVVITGASCGIGQEFVQTLSSLNPKLKFFNLSRTPPPDVLAKGRLWHYSTDLSVEAGPEEAASAAAAWLDDEGRNGEILLINNSGFGSYGEFPAPGLDRSLAMIDLNVRAPVVLTGRLLSRLRERGGMVVNIASTAAFQPTPLMSVYGATKAFLMNWSLGLWRELRGTGVHVLCVCPGPTETNFFRAAGLVERPVPLSNGCATSKVVWETLNALGARRPLVVCGFLNKLAVMISGRLPRALVAGLTYDMMKKFKPGSCAPAGPTGATSIPSEEVSPGVLR